MPDVKRWPTSRLLSTAARLIEQGCNDKLRPLGLTLPAVIALEAVAATGPITQTGLAEIVRVRAQTLGPTLNKLEAHGYLSRQHAPGNRRNQYVAITGAGMDILQKAQAAERAVLAELSVDPAKLRDELESIVLKAARPPEQRKLRQGP